MFHKCFIWRGSTVLHLPQRADEPRLEYRRAYAPFSVPKVHTPKAGGRAGRPAVTTDAEYARVALAYRRALDSGQQKAAEVVADSLGLTSAAHLRMVVHRGAKRRGLIASAGGGVWHLTPEALALVEPSSKSKGTKHGRTARKR